MKQISWGRTLLAAAVVEIGVVVVMLLLILLFSPRELGEGTAYIRDTAQWVNPLGSFLFCFIGGWWVAQKSTGSPLVSGMAVGAVNVVLDLSLAAALGSAFPALVFVSQGGRLIAATLGGLVVSARRGSLSQGN